MQRALGCCPVVHVVECCRVRHALTQRDALAGVGAPGDERLQRVRVEEDLGIEHGSIVGGEGVPVRDSVVPVPALRRVGPAFQIGVGRFIRRDHARARSGLDRHVADRHAALHREGPDGASAELEHITLPAARTDLRDDREDDVFRCDARSEGALDRDRHRLERVQREGLGGEHVLDLRGSDAEGHRAERAMRRCVAVSTDDGDAGHREPELRSYDVHDALLDVAERVQAYSELGGIIAQGLDLRAAGEVGDRLVDGQRRGVVVFRGDREIEPAHGTTGLAEAVERLRARDLMHEVQVDVDEVGRAVLAFDDQVVFPDLLGQSLRSAVHARVLRRSRARPSLVLLCNTAPRRGRQVAKPRRGREEEADRNPCLESITRGGCGLLSPVQPG